MLGTHHQACWQIAMTHLVTQPQSVALRRQTEPPTFWVVVLAGSLLIHLFLLLGLRLLATRSTSGQPNTPIPVDIIETDVVPTPAASPTASPPIVPSNPTAPTPAPTTAAPFPQPSVDPEAPTFSDDTIATAPAPSPPLTQPTPSPTLTPAPFPSPTLTPAPPPPQPTPFPSPTQPTASPTPLTRRPQTSQPVTPTPTPSVTPSIPAQPQPIPTPQVDPNATAESDERLPNVPSIASQPPAPAAPESETATRLPLPEPTAVPKGIRLTIDSVTPAVVKTGDVGQRVVDDGEPRSYSFPDVPYSVGSQSLVLKVLIDRQGKVRLLQNGQPREAKYVDGCLEACFDTVVSLLPKISFPRLKQGDAVLPVEGVIQVTFQLEPLHQGNEGQAGDQ